MAEAPPFVHRVRRFGESLGPHASELDRDVAAVRTAALDFQSQGLNILGSPRVELGSVESFECLASLAEFSGSFAFLALQQWVANLNYGDRGETVWPRLTVAFGHLRNPQSPSPTWSEGRASGTVPWMTGAGIVERTFLGVRGPEGDERYVWVSARSRHGFRVMPRRGLLACDGAANAAVELRDLPVKESSFVRISRKGALARGDAQSTVWHTPLMIGCGRASLRLIEASSRIDGEPVRRVRESFEALQSEILAAIGEGVSARKGMRLRSRASAASVRLASLACLAHGGQSLAPGHPAGRLYREAMVYRLMAQTDALVADAFEAESK